MSKTAKTIGGIIIAVVIIGGIWLIAKPQSQRSSVKIGIITDLTGPAAYWGESTRIGAEIAKEELEKEGYNIDLKFEDYQLDGAKALTSAQKLIDIDNVDAIYAEFNPAAIPVGSFMKDKNKIFMYVAAVTSPLEGNDNAFKTYLDYQAGCREVANKFFESGLEKVGVFKINLEAGELCLSGIKEVFGDDIVMETYNLGDTDFKTQVLKMKNSGVNAIINVGFEGDTLNALKAINELKFDVLYGTVDDAITEQVKQKFSEELKGARSFGFSTVNSNFSSKIKEKSNNISSEYGAALAYTHIKQIVEAMGKCGSSDNNCIQKSINSSTADKTIGFKSFNNNIADLDMLILQY